MFVPVSPLVIPLLTAIAALFARRFKMIQSVIALIGASVHLGFCGFLFGEVAASSEPLAVGMGGWPAPLGIFVVVDTLSASLVTVTAFVHLIVTVHGLASADEDRRRSDFWPLANTLVMGVQGAFITGDLFNLYVWFEVLLISSFVLVALGNTRLQIEAAAKYVVVNLLSSACFLIGIALVFGMTGTLNLADLALKLRSGVLDSQLLPVVAMLFIIGFGIKSAMVPLSVWLPSAYSAPPATLAALLAALLTKVGVYSLLRVGTLLFSEQVPAFNTVLLVGAFLSIAMGAIGAFAQANLRSLVTHTVVFAVGFMLFGIGIGTEAGLAASIFYLLSDMIVVATLVLLSGEIERITGKSRLSEMGGLYRSHPWVAMAFLMTALSVAGFPPFVGFWAKISIFSAGVGAGYWPAVLLALVGSAVTLSAIVQAWSLGLWKPQSFSYADPRVEWGRVFPIGVLVILLVGLSLAPGPLAEVSARAASELVDVESYGKAVFK